MREILFRGFCENFKLNETIVVNGRTFHGKWVCGYFIGGEDESFDWIQPFVVVEDGTKRVLPVCEIMPETVGMKYDKCDKNGNPIYVGDIIALTTADGEKITIECKFGTVQRQIYENLVEITGFYFERSNDGRKTFPIVNNYLGKHDTEIWEVIGTIFDVKEEEHEG